MNREWRGDPGVRVWPGSAGITWEWGCDPGLGVTQESYFQFDRTAS